MCSITLNEQNTPGYREMVKAEARDRYRRAGYSDADADWYETTFKSNDINAWMSDADQYIPQITLYGANEAAETNTPGTASDFSAKVAQGTGTPIHILRQLSGEANASSLAAISRRCCANSASYFAEYIEHRRLASAGSRVLREKRTSFLPYTSTKSAGMRMRNCGLRPSGLDSRCLPFFTSLMLQNRSVVERPSGTEQRRTRLGR